MSTRVARDPLSWSHMTPYGAQAARQALRQSRPAGSGACSCPAGSALIRYSRYPGCRNAAGRARGHYGAGSALQEPHTARPNQSSVGMASTNPRGGSMGLQGPPYAVLSPLVTDPLAPPGDPESSLFLTCHFVLKARGVQNETRTRLILLGIRPQANMANLSYKPSFPSLSYTCKIQIPRV